MRNLAGDLLAEYRGLADLCGSLTDEQWRQRTDFHGWTPWDEVAHLLYFDETALQAVSDAAAFDADKDALNGELATGMEISAITRRRYGHLDGKALLQLWRQRHEALVEQLAGKDPKARLPWYGPTMSARSFATARLMETWAHGQDIWDMLGRERPPGPGLRHITHLGVTTYGWTFVNRQLPVPAPTPYVELQAPDGGSWTWGEPSGEHFVHGPALDFALLVTQRRNRADTALSWRGDAADQWTRLAQCFAGEPADGPAPGARVSRR
ncbi:putative Actinobacterial protein [Variovorax sp. PBL-H6]|uniref:TIGR03084 family metal-binding protein n=1 Tax=Variovorax sp. PBL-H6 TaxID=434009 RepID=UPI0013179975|nr:TIGR03084 family metal-binding protein [Variovorax sp. PBL-H6]VTU24822.1 putative Actinobacterial protein [Variovorax sp. PBL-H6]